MYYFWAYDTHEAANDFAINFSNGRLQIFANFKMDKVLDWKHSLPIQANYFSMSAINSYDNLVVNLVTPGNIFISYKLLYFGIMFHNKS